MPGSREGVLEVEKPRVQAGHIHMRAFYAAKNAEFGDRNAPFKCNY
jgi:hypothetical protein